MTREQFLANVEEIDGHAYWLGSKVVKYENQAIRPHRLSYIVHKGVVPFGMAVYRTCGEERCIHPDHLILMNPMDYFDDHLRKYDL